MAAVNFVVLLNESLPFEPGGFTLVQVTKASRQLKLKYRQILLSPTLELQVQSSVEESRKHRISKERDLE